MQCPDCLGTAECELNIVDVTNEEFLQATISEVVEVEEERNEVIEDTIELSDDVLCPHCKAQLAAFNVRFCMNCGWEEYLF